MTHTPPSQKHFPWACQQRELQCFPQSCCCCCCWVTSVVSDSVRPHPSDSPGKNTGVGCHFLLQCMKVKRESEVAQSCPTLRDPLDCSPPASSIHGIFQARVLEWGAIAFSAPELHFSLKTPSPLPQSRFFLSASPDQMVRHFLSFQDLKHSDLTW